MERKWKASIAIRNIKAMESKKHTIGELRRYARSLGWNPQTRPPGWVIVRSASGTRAPYALCHDTCVAASASQIDEPKLPCSSPENMVCLPGNVCWTMSYCMLSDTGRSNKVP
jgi:hypothetical protein